MLLLSALMLVSLPAAQAARNALYLRNVQIERFSKGPVGREEFLTLLGIEEENLWTFGYDDQRKDFTFEDLKRVFTRLLKGKDVKGRFRVP